MRIVVKLRVNAVLMMMMAIPLASSYAQSAWVPPVESFGHNIPLQIAVRHIIPNGMEVRFGHSSLQNRRVSWAAGNDWRDVLRRSVRAQGLRMNINEDGGYVYIFVSPSPNVREFGVQIGAMSSELAAQRLWRAVSSQVPSINDMNARIEEFGRDNRIVWRVRVYGFRSEAEAMEACGVIRNLANDCFVFEVRA